MFPQLYNIVISAMIFLAFFRTSWYPTRHIWFVLRCLEAFYLHRCTDYFGGFSTMSAVFFMIWYVIFWVPLSYTFRKHMKLFVWVCVSTHAICMASTQVCKIKNALKIWSRNPNKIWPPFLLCEVFRVRLRVFRPVVYCETCAELRAVFDNACASSGAWDDGIAVCNAGGENYFWIIHSGFLFMIYMKTTFIILNFVCCLAYLPFQRTS